MRTVPILAVSSLIAVFSASTMAVAAEKNKKPTLDTKPGPAYRMLEGKVKKVEGQVYTVEDYEGNEVQVYVSQDTKALRGPKKAGDTLRAEITVGHHANSVQ